MNASDEGRILEEGISLAKSCASAQLMNDQNAIYELLEQVADPEVIHTAFIYAITQWSHAMKRTPMTTDIFTKVDRVTSPALLRIRFIQVLHNDRFYFYFCECSFLNS